ncbi:aminoacyl tRNA synthase complex-interacting multifunctional protein 1-like isoform X1 [Anneissia japonica]|uniref:aminoacyl tRNA synthase complex-interacting multifunctional protein 1-like isoform X1 n=1 Tax=Anneissia japonica TaxID=1529436 RepID=UPI00142583B3|nr:aminoacyl tRNA synthase complex-interacting multifunctional protein 1-like isoform X1 [Anneissia japonica]
MFLLRTTTKRLRMASSAVKQRLEQRAQEADQLISQLKKQVDQLRTCAVASGSSSGASLAVENAQLRLNIERLKTKLNELEARNGFVQVSLPNAGGKSLTQNVTPVVANEPAPPVTPVQKAGESKPKKEKKEKKGGGKPPEKKDDVPVTISAMDLRIGKIVGVKRHPDADSLYVEDIDCGEAEPRTVVSGLVNHVPIEEMQDRIVIICCNLKPAKMRGILSQAMVMCASGDTVELLTPPAGSVPGDRISFDGFPLDDFPPQMNPKKKVLEKILADLFTNEDKVATYKGIPWKVEGKGICKAPTMAKTKIK